MVVIWLQVNWPYDTRYAIRIRQSVSVERRKPGVKPLEKCGCSGRGKLFEKPEIEMKIARPFGIILVVVCVASALSSCCEISRELAANNIGPDAPLDTDPPLN